MDELIIVHINGELTITTCSILKVKKQFEINRISYFDILPSDVIGYLYDFLTPLSAFRLFNSKLHPSFSQNTKLIWKVNGDLRPGLRDGRYTCLVKMAINAYSEMSTRFHYLNVNLIPKKEYLFQDVRISELEYIRYLPPGFIRQITTINRNLLIRCIHHFPKYMISPLPYFEKPPEFKGSNFKSFFSLSKPSPYFILTSLDYNERFCYDCRDGYFTFDMLPKREISKRNFKILCQMTHGSTVFILHKPIWKQRREVSSQINNLKKLIDIGCPLPRFCSGWYVLNFPVIVFGDIKLVTILDIHEWIKMIGDLSRQLMYIHRIGYFDYQNLNFVGQSLITGQYFFLVYDFVCYDDLPNATMKRDIRNNKRNRVINNITNNIKNKIRKNYESIGYLDIIRHYYHYDSIVRKTYLSLIEKVDLDNMNENNIKFIMDELCKLV